MIHTVSMQLTILGLGTSHGIPVLGCQCKVCCSSDFRDQRMRSSIYIKEKYGACAIIDTGPEFRLQAIRAKITCLDGIFLTHAHADHVHVLDDIRPLCFEKPIPVYGNSFTLNDLQERFSYIFRETQNGGGKPKITPFVEENPIHIGKIVFTPIPVKHGIVDILGWKISEGSKTAVYLTDVKSIPHFSLPLIQNPDVIIIGALRLNPHATHFNFLEALEAAAEIKARSIYLTHICHDYSHREIENFCREFKEKRGISAVIEPAYDGQELIV